MKPNLDRCDDDLLSRGVQAFQQMSTPPAPPVQELLFQLGVSANSPVLAGTSYSLWRRISMQSMFRFAVAASLLMVLATSLVMMGAPTPALADVIKAAERHKVVKYKIKQTTDDKTLGTASLDSVAYADLLAPRFRNESGALTLNRTVQSTHYSVIDGDKNECLSVLTEVATGNVDETVPQSLKDLLASGKFPRKEAHLSRAEGDFTPATDVTKKSILENLQLLEQHDDVVAIKENREGKELLKYRLEDGNTTTTLWVDPATDLPVRLERESLDPVPQIARNQWTLSDFEWDPQLPEGTDVDALFSTTPPVGYTLTDHRKAESK